MKRNVWALLSVLLVASMLLTACGPKATPTAAPTAAPTVKPAEQEVTLRWRTRPDNQAEIDVYQSISNDLDASWDKVKLVYEPGGSESSSYQDVLKTEIAAGTAPDVFWIPGTDVADFANRGLIMDLRAMANKTPTYKDSDFYAAPMYHLTFDPKSSKTGVALWGLPRDVSTFVLYLNLDLLNEAGAEDPRELAKAGKWDWNAFMEVASAVRGLGKDIYGYGQNAWWGPYGLWLASAGGGFFNEDRTACALDTPESIKGLEFERSIYEAGVAVPYGEDSEPPFLAGRVAMFQNGRWGTPGIRSSAKFKWDVVEPPAGPDGLHNWLFWGAYVVNAKTANPEKAWELVQKLTTAETQGKVSALGANIPSRVTEEAKTAFLTFTPPANNQAFLNGLALDPVAEGPLWAGSWPEYDAIMGAKVTAVLNGEMSIDEFRNSICAEANKVFTTPPTSTAPVGEQITLRWRTRPDNQAEIDVYQSISNDLDGKMGNVKLVYEPGGSESSSYQDVLKTEIAAGTAPDVFWIPGTDVADFANRGLIMDLRAMANKTPTYKDSDFYAAPMYHLTFDPKSSKTGVALWGLPRDVSTFALYLNLDLLNEAGAEDPRELAKAGKWDWDAFMEVASAVSALGKDIYGYGQNAWWGPYGLWLASAGGGFFNEDRTACALDTPESIKGLEFQRSIYEAGVAVPYGEDSEPPFLAGRVAMFQNGRWATPGTRSSAKFKWDVVEPPAGPDGLHNWLFWGAYVVNAKTTHPEEAWKLVQELTTAETQGKVAALGANIPSRVTEEAKAKFLTFTPPANNQAFLNGLALDPVAEGPLWAGSWPEYDAIMGAKVTAVLNGEMSIEEFRNSICAEANKVFKK